MNLILHTTAAKLQVISVVGAEGGIWGVRTEESRRGEGGGGRRDLELGSHSPHINVKTGNDLHCRDRGWGGGRGREDLVSDSSSSDKCETFSTKQSLTSLHRNDFRQLDWFSENKSCQGK